MTNAPDLARLRTLAERRAETERDLDAAIVAARENGATFPAIAEALGITKQGAMKRHESACKRIG